MAKELTEQQRLFCVEFVKTGNATTAAKSVGYSAKSANVIGCQLIKKQHIAAEIDRLRGRIEKKSELNAGKVMTAMNGAMDFDPAELFGDDGKLLRMRDIPLAIRQCIQSIDYDKQLVKFIPRLGAIELSSKLLGMLKVEQQTQQAVQIIIAQQPELPASSVEKPQILPVWDDVGLQDSK